MYAFGNIAASNYAAKGKGRFVNKNAVCAVRANGIMVTNNYWNTFTLKVPTGSDDCISACISDDGRYIYVGNSDAGGVHGMYRSADFGATWAARYAPYFGPYTDICCSQSGQYVYMVVDTGKAYQSSNYGVNWTEAKPADWWKSCACSGDGRYVYLNYEHTGVGGVFCSGDYGVTFGAASVPAASYIQRVCCSENGAIVYGVKAGAIHKSVNYGAAWAAAVALVDASNRNPGQVACTANGGKIVVGATGFKSVLSEDAGATWAEIDENSTCPGALISPLGKYIMLAQNADHARLGVDAANPEGSVATGFLPRFW